MTQHVLPIAGPIVEGSEHAQDLVAQAPDVRFDGGILADLEDFIVHVDRCLIDHFFDAGGMDAAILDQPFHRPPRHFASDGMKAADHDDAGRVVNNDVHAGGLLEGPNVATLAADDSTLHVIMRDFNGGYGCTAGLIGGEALDGGGDDLSALFIHRLRGLVQLLFDNGSHFMFALLFQALQQQVLGGLGGHGGHLEKLVFLLRDDAGELLVL